MALRVQMSEISTFEVSTVVDDPSLSIHTMKAWTSWPQIECGTSIAPQNKPLHAEIRSKQRRDPCKVLKWGIPSDKVVT
jgi:hypothetical protein